MDCVKLFNIIKPYKLSKLLGISSSTVYSWKTGGIPKWRVAAIVEVCQKQGIDVSDCVET